MTCYYMSLIHDMLGYIFPPWFVTWYISPLSITSCISITCYCFISDYITGLLSITWYDLFITLSTACQFFRLVSFMFPFNTCISPNMLDSFVGPWLALIMIYYLLHIITCHAITSYPAWYNWPCDYYVYGNLALLSYMELSATSSNGGGHL